MDNTLATFPHGLASIVCCLQITDVSLALLPSGNFGDRVLRPSVHLSRRLHFGDWPEPDMSANHQDNARPSCLVFGQGSRVLPLLRNPTSKNIECLATHVRRVSKAAKGGAMERTSDTCRLL